MDIAFYDMLKILYTRNFSLRKFSRKRFFREKCFHSDLRLDRQKLTFTDASDTEKQKQFVSDWINEAIACDFK